jgi:hypothetical protein
VPGQTYLQQFRCGRETTFGVAVVPTRRLYFMPGSGLAPGGSATRHTFLTGTRDQTLAATPGVQEPAGPFEMRVSHDECLEVLACFFGPATVTTPGGGTTTRLHTFTPGTAPDSMTIQWDDGARPWQSRGVYVNTMRIAGTASGTNALSGEFFGVETIQTALTGTATARQPSFFEGYETQLYLENMTGADNYGTTLIAAGASITSWSVELNNNLGRVYTAANTQAMNEAVVNPMEATGTVTFKASGATALTEYTNFRAATPRRMRLRFGTNDILEGALTAFFDLDIGMVWTSFNLLGEEAGIRLYEAGFGFIFDSVANFGVRVRCQNARTAAF